MTNSRGGMFVLVVASLALLFGCSAGTGGQGIAADAVPISVRVVPSLGQTPLVSIETDLMIDTNSTWTLWYFFDVRDPAAAGAAHHLNVNDYLALSDASRIQFVPAGKRTWSISVLLEKARSADVDVFVTVVAADTAGKRGAVGSTKVPKSIPE